MKWTRPKTKMQTDTRKSYQPFISKRNSIDNLEFLIPDSDCFTAEFFQTLKKEKPILHKLSKNKR